MEDTKLPDKDIKVLAILGVVAIAALNVAFFWLLAWALNLAIDPAAL